MVIETLQGDTEAIAGCYIIKEASGEFYPCKPDIFKKTYFEPKEGYWLAYSGGKDSIVIKRLAEMAGVKFEAHYNVTSVDPPELVRFIKKQKDVYFDVPKDKNGKPITMWSLISKKENTTDTYHKILLRTFKRIKRKRKVDNNRCKVGRKCAKEK